MCLIAILVELQKAFEEVDHEILLKKLFDIGIRGKTQFIIEIAKQRHKNLIQKTIQDTYNNTI